MQTPPPPPPPPNRPPKLEAGSRVALVAPAGPLRGDAELATAVANARALGLVPEPGPHCTRRHGYLAGSDDERLADLQHAIADPDIRAVWCLRGGYGTTRILDRVDFSPLRRNPKIIVGFSDITAFLLAAQAETGLVVFHGPVARRPLAPFSRRSLERAIFSPDPAGLLELPSPPAPGSAESIATLREGTAEGPLFGGNLSLLHCLVGTRWFPSLDGAILFLEDVNEKLYTVDRMLAHLRSIGALDRLAGVAIGRFTEFAVGPDDGSLGLDEVLDTYLKPLGVPVAAGFPVGHIAEQWTLPIGVRARLDAGAGTLTVLEAAVR
ncbi:MAG: S66 peptidase family protein [Gemmatimonadales bacterium]